MKIRGSTALITGGASGLGFAVASRFIGQGGRAVVLDLPKESNEAKVKALGEAALFIAGDVTDEEQVQGSIDKARSHFSSLEICVHCAGIAFAVKTLQKGMPSELEIFSKTQQVNLVGTFNVCRLAAAAMAKNQPNEAGERGVLINTGSIAAYDGQMGQTAYAASKGGIAALTLPLARDLAQYGIRVMTIAPGIFDTPLFGSLPESARSALGQQVPFPPRLGKPEEFAALAQHIVENPMLNGEVIRLDGALRLGMK